MINNKKLKKFGRQIETGFKQIPKAFIPPQKKKKNTNNQPQEEEAVLIPTATLITPTPPPPPPQPPQLQPQKVQNQEKPVPSANWRLMSTLPEGFKYITAPSKIYDKRKRINMAIRELRDDLDHIEKTKYQQYSSAMEYEQERNRLQTKLNEILTLSENFERVYSQYDADAVKGEPTPIGGGSIRKGRLVKGSPEAKAYMASLRAMRKGKH